MGVTSKVVLSTLAAMVVGAAPASADVATSVSPSAVEGGSSSGCSVVMYDTSTTVRHGYVRFYWRELCGELKGGLYLTVQAQGPGGPGSAQNSGQSCIPGNGRFLTRCNKTVDYKLSRGRHGYSSVAWGQASRVPYGKISDYCSAATKDIGITYNG